MTRKSLKFLVMVSPGSISLSNVGFEEEPFFPAKTFLFAVFFSLLRGKRRWPTAAAGLETDLKREFTQEEQVKRVTPPGASRRASFKCGGLVGPDVPLLRQRRVCSAPRRAFTDVKGSSPGPGPTRGCSGHGVSRQRPGANLPCRDRFVASVCVSGAARLCRAREAVSPSGAGVDRLCRDRDAASPCGSGAAVRPRHDHDARAVDAAPLRCAGGGGR